MISVYTISSTDVRLLMCACAVTCVREQAGERAVRDTSGTKEQCGIQGRAREQCGIPRGRKNSAECRDGRASSDECRGTKEQYGMQGRAVRGWLCVNRRSVS